MSSLDNKRQSTASVVLTTEVIVEVSVPDKALTPTVGVYAVPTHASSVTSITSNPHSEKTTTNPFDADIEALNSHSSLDKSGRKSMTMDAAANCPVWPGKDHWKKQAKHAKMQRTRCTPMARLSARNKVICKILIIVLVVGAAVSIGLGISKAVGAPVWGGKKSD